jgi:hypothetical protein
MNYETAIAHVLGGLCRVTRPKWLSMESFDPAELTTPKKWC